MKASTVVSATQPNGVYGQPLPKLTKSAENEGTNGVWWILYSGTEDTEYEISETKPTAAGKYIVIADYSSGEYKGCTVGPFVIKKAPLTAKPTDKSIYVGDALPTDFALTYGFVNGDTTAVLTVSGTPEYALKNGETALENSNTAADYIIAWSNEETVEIAADNYTVTKSDGV